VGNLVGVTTTVTTDVQHKFTTVLRIFVFASLFLRIIAELLVGLSTKFYMVVRCDL